MRAAHDPVDQPRVLGQADHVGVLVGHDADPDLADHRTKVVAAGTAHCEWPDNHQLVEVLGVGKLGDRRLHDIATLEDLVEVHLGHPSRGVLGVVVTVGVDDQAVEHALHLDFHLVQQQLQLTGLNELGNVVVGMKALASAGKALADLDGHGRAFVGGGRGHVGTKLSEHGGMVTAICLAHIARVLGLERLHSKR